MADSNGGLLEDFAGSLGLLVTAVQLFPLHFCVLFINQKTYNSLYQEKQHLSSFKKNKKKVLPRVYKECQFGSLPEAQAVEAVSPVLSEVTSQIAPRSICISYMIPEFHLTLSVQHWRDELELRLGALVKEATIGCTGGLELLPWEQQCAAAPVPRNLNKECSLGDAILGPYRAARKAAAKMVTGLPNPSLKDIDRELTSEAHVLRAIDASWNLDAAYFKRMSGNGLETKMWQQILATLPSHQENKSIAETLAAIQTLQESPLHSYLSVGLEAQLSACKKMAQELGKGICPGGVEGAS